jgi:hypothetical protein
MSDHDPRKPWEPDPNRVGTNWTSMFEQPRSGGATPTPSATPTPAASPTEDEALAPDLTVYKPWVLQRGRSRPSLMLGLRRYDPRSGQWIGWGVSYANLFAVEYIGDRMVSLDFGLRQYVIEGRGLDELARRIKQGTVTTVLEYSAAIWPQPTEAAMVTAIKRIEASEQDR